MDKIYIEIEINTKNNETEIETDVSNFVALFVYCYLAPKNIKLIFVSTTVGHGKIKLCSQFSLLCRALTEERIFCKTEAKLKAIRDLRLPIYAKSENTFIAGLCAVCRELVMQQECPELRKLLGFKNGCLQASAESSIWTRFCELNMVQALHQLLLKEALNEDIDEIPMEVARFERHMNEPVRMHNIYKLAREQANSKKKIVDNRKKAGGGDEEATAVAADPTTTIVGPATPNAMTKKQKQKSKVIIDCTTPKEELPIEHRFAEGIAFTIADLILYPSMKLIFNFFPEMLQHFPLTSTWLCEIDSFEPKCGEILTKLHIPPQRIANYIDSGSTIKIVDCEAKSLYKSDPKRYKPRNRIFTEQSELDNTLSKLQALELTFSSDNSIVFDENPIDWNLIEPEHEKSSALPKERLLRKRQQLENLANAIATLALPGERIIDFCSGTGHLGILLALQLPQCTVILMENKTYSLERAKQRVTELNLKNCHFYQCNIDYFVGQFDIGTSLHACGTATDIVLQQCIRSGAKFICCPCCYGSLQPMPHIVYPLSKRFRSVLTEKDFLHIAHCADQAHELGTRYCKPETTIQGQLCMDIVDTDRKLHAEEAGYEVILTRLKPEQCTPKNRLLVGKLSTRS